MKIDSPLLQEALERGVERIYPDSTSVKERLGNERLRFYFGIDPTGPTLHIGHTAPLLKAADLQKLGHEIIILIGNFTAQIGDPTDKTAARKRLTPEEVHANAAVYKDQLGVIIDFAGPNPAVLKYNADWLAPMTFGDVVELAATITVDQMLKRDMFRRRMEEGKPVYVHEFLYPLMQGYDSIALDVDGEIGGNDQTFNMLVGRDLAAAITKKDKIVIATKLLVDSSGKKMGKTEGNIIALSDAPEHMFGKVMSWPDERIIPGFELLTRVPMEDIAELEKDMAAGKNPMQAKLRLARAITALYHGEQSAERSEQAFREIFSNGKTPDDMPIIPGERGALLADLLASAGAVSSKTEWRRLVDEKAVTDMDTKETVIDPYAKLEKTLTLRIGKKRFVRITL